MKVLSKYAKARDVTNVLNTTQKEYLESLTTQATLQAPDDYNNPYNFSDWFNRNTDIIPNQEKQQYDEYLKTWYKSRYTSVDVATDLKNDYVQFLKNLNVILNKEDKTNVLNDINWDDSLDVEQVIPLYAKKLKEIAIYLINKRLSIKKAKLKYNISGANQAIEKLFYEYLLKAFTKREYILNIPDQEIYSTFPELSSVNKGFKIVIEELYDDASYFDKNPALSAADYFNTVNADASAFYDNLNIAPSAYEWLFKTGFAPLCANNPLFIIMDDLLNTEQPLSAYADIDNKILNEYYQFKLNQKFLGENQYYVSGGYYIPYEITVNYNLQTGNNWFYLPSGEFINEYKFINFDSIALSSTSLVENGATSYKNYLSADKIFIKTGNTVAGAWLKGDKITTITENLSAQLVNTIFKYPFPNYGLSSEDFGWTGPQLSNLDNSFEYLEDSLKQTIKNAYWSYVTTTSSLCVLNIQDSMLIENKATAGKYYEIADHITIRDDISTDGVHDTTPDEIYAGNAKHAWLYQMEKTDLPIKRGKNYLQWPLIRYENSDTTALRNVLTSQCAPIALSSMCLSSFIGSRAGYGLFDSDIIYKLNGTNGTPTECAYLSGTIINQIGNTTFTANATGIIQTALSLVCNPNNSVTFIWTDDDTPINNINLKHIPHQADCPYLYEEQYSLDKENPSDQKLPDYRLWKKCECKAILYSPLGHPGQKFEDYNSKSDIIYLDRFYPVPFNKTTWIGLDNENCYNSEDFAWFKLDGNYKIEPDVGWGSGNWVAGANPVSGREFILKKGYQYKYLRNDLNHSKTFLTDGTVPYLVIKNLYNNSPEPIWIKAVANTDGSWESFDEISDMVINPNDYLVYDHIDSNWYCITGIGDFDQAVVYNTSALNVSSNKWINYTFATTGTSMVIAWPNILYNEGPQMLAYSLSTVKWEVIQPNNVSLIFTLLPTEPLTIVPMFAGNWIVNVTGYPTAATQATNVVYQSVANFYISPVLSTETTSGERSVETIYADTINMSWNTPIYGWNYVTHAYDGVALGARPFWAYASNANEKITKHKGIDIWGGGITFVDDYVPITQPNKSDIEFKLGMYLEYHALSTFIWVEPLTFNVNITSNNWCDLIIDNTKVATLSDYLYNLNKEIIVSATNNVSNLTFAQEFANEPIFINYFATKAFIWSQKYNDTSLGIPPTGGIFIPIVSGDLIMNVLPYLNLTNRHFPTIATVPHVEELYTTEETGGYFVPRMLGVSTALSKYDINIINSTKISNNISGANAFEVFTNLNYFNSETSLSKTEQNIVLDNDSTDSSWMKSPISSGKKAGNIIGASKHQQFIPYKTKYENTGINTCGTHQQTDTYDPWFGDEDNTWENNIDWPITFNKQYPIDKWYLQTIPNEYQIYQWKTDIFNNQYTLFKNITNTTSMYDKKHNTNGTLWIRNYRNTTQQASAILSDIYNTVSNINIDYVSILNNNILDIDIYYDTLMYYTSVGVFLFKLNQDYNTGDLTSESNGIIITLSSNHIFGGTWMMNDKTVILCTLLSSEDQIRPILSKFDIDKNILTYVYNVSNHNTNMSTYNLTAFEHPVMMYDITNKIYNVSYIAYGTDKVGMYLNTINIKNLENDFEIIDAKTIVPDE